MKDIFDIFLFFIMILQLYKKCGKIYPKYSHSEVLKWKTPTA